MGKKPDKNTNYGTAKHVNRVMETDQNAKQKQRDGNCRVKYRADDLILENKEKNTGKLIATVFRTSCTYMTLNAKSPYGRIRVQLTGMDGNVLPGFSFDECEPIVGDALAHPVRWRDYAKLPPLKSKGIIAEIEISNASIYAINFATDK